MIDVVKKVAEIVKSSGGRALAVGGCVRDGLLGYGVINDFDIECFSISPERLEVDLSKAFELDLVGKSFGVIKLRHYDIDIAIPRKETKLGLGHRAFELEYDPQLSIREAASRRDFTVNAIYSDPLTGEIIDPWGGREDLEKGVLRHVSNHFSEDPLRVLRGMQFVSRFNLIADRETLGLCRAMTPENLPRERLIGEWKKLLIKGKSISRGLTFLRETGWVKYYPELESLIGCRQDKRWHPEGDVWNHTLCSLDAFAVERDEHDYGDDENLIVALAVLCHDFGKPLTTRCESYDGRIRSLGHDEAGVAPTISFLKRLTNEERILKEVPPLVKAHMRPFSLWKNKSSDSAIRRLSSDVGRIDRLLRVASADEGGRPPFPRQIEHLEWLKSQSLRLAVADAVPKPILMGRDLMDIGMKPSKEFGIILKNAYEAQLDGEFFDKAGAMQFVRRKFR